MGKFIDIFLIAALVVNLYIMLGDYQPEYTVYGTTTIPSWVAVLIQVVCIILLGYKVWKNYAAGKQV